MAEQNYHTQEQDVFVFPASYAQQRLWFLDQFEPNSPFYNIPSAVRFRGELNLDALYKSIHEIIARHETLRTTFGKVDGNPVQIIHPGLKIDIPIIDLSSREEEHRETEAIKLAQKEARKPFNLSTGPLVRVTILKLDENDHVILFTLHHIISDGWSMGVLIKEVSILYSTFSKSLPSPLPELPIQYADFAEWQQEWLTGDVLEKQISYWKDQLDGSLQILELPTDRPRPAVQTANGDDVSRVLPKTLTQSIKKLCSQEDVTIFMALLAAFNTLLHRYTNQESITVGSPIANRTRAEVEELIGFFVNTLVLKSDFYEDQTFRQLLQKVKETTLGGYANQDVPFERLVEILQPDRDMSHSPLFQVMFILQNNPMSGGIDLPEVSLSTLDINAGTSTFDLTLMVTEQSQGLDVTIEYNTDLFDADTMHRMIDHFEMLLTSIVADPDQDVSKLSILPEAEFQKEVIEWNNYDSDYPQHVNVNHVFEKQVEETPHNVAVSTCEESITYEDLNRRANQLAHYLQKRGVGPEQVVSICAGKSIELIVAVLGVMKAGGAYLPIDPTYPEERIAYMLEDSKASILLTMNELVDQLPDSNADVISIDATWDEISKESAENAVSGTNENNLVYLIYTSGSTGKSKGVMVVHKTLVNAYYAWEEAYLLKQGVSSHLQMASFSFDVFSGDFVRGLLSGGKLVLVNRDLLLEAEKLYHLMVQEKVDCAEFVPAVLRNLIQYLEETGQNLAFMKALIAGSDSWYVAEYKEFQKYCGPETRLINSFGLTEATIDSTYFESIHQLTSSNERLVPIGIPFANTKIYILDRHLQPVPIGVPGELCVGGAGLARGYFNRPDLTSEKFIADPFSQEPDARMYKTGDLARFLPDGNIEFLGRIDNQVKIRGFRIELGEIESTLGKHPDVSEVVVTAWEDRPGNKRLVAYVVVDNDEESMVSELRTYLKEKLPDYMVPSFFIILDAMPLTPNGKIDRRSLPAPDQDTIAEASEVYVAPRTPSEEKVAVIWSKILNIEKIGIHDNFFELGGHSLLATQVVSRIREAFDVEIPLRNIFEFPTVAELTHQIDVAVLSDTGLVAPPIVPVSRDQEMPLSFAQQRLWFLDQLEPGSPFYNIPDAVRFQGALNIDALEASINEIVKRHESLRTNFIDVDGKPSQIIHESRTIPMKKIDLRELPKARREAEVERLAKEEAQQPFNLSDDALLRVTMLMLDEEEFVILFTVHHIISDDWSSSVLIQELAIIYDAFNNNRPSPLPEPVIQYADYAHWQQNWLQGEVLENHLNYWKNQLSDSPMLLELPTDKPRPSVQTFNGSFVNFEIPEDLTKSIRSLCNQDGATLFMTLLAAFQTLLYRYSGQDDICVGSPIANRTKSEMESLIGLFINTLVFRTDLAGDPSFKELLSRVRKVALEAYAHQDIPFEKLVDILRLDRDLSHSPLFQAMLVLQNAPMDVQELPGLRISPLETHSGTAKYDLTMFIVEEGDKLSGALEYNTDLFEEGTINRMLKHFQILLKGITSKPEQHIAKIPLISEAEAQQFVIEMNATQVGYTNDQYIHKMFEMQVDENPEAMAVVFDAEKLSYSELNESANQLAHYLQKMGVGPEVMVGICMERSLELMVALMGTLKAGGAYVPIDPSYPSERLNHMLHDSNVQVLLTQEKLKSHFPADIDHVICLDKQWEEIEPENNENPDVHISTDNLAYVIYTSGSTGTPKGTLISHKGLRNYLCWCMEAYSLKEGRGSLVHSSLAFDATITGLYAPLLVGRTVYLAPETKDIEILKKILTKEQNFSLIKITPAHLELLGQQLEPEVAAKATHSFIIGGENLTTEHIEFWQKHAPDTLLVNEYGPTETVVGCMNYRVPADLHAGSVSIGHSINNMQIYILDAHLNPVPTGVKGEMYIGGLGVARGYHNRPDLTAEKFIPDPFSQEPGTRFYKTGDLARYYFDGNIEFLGRLDDQVKIRGFRIELGEIEAVLGQHSAIEEVVVIAGKASKSAEFRLVAYIVTTDDSMPSISELRDFLKEKLPEYMIPSIYMKLDELPLTPNGKVDRKALPEPEITRSEMHKTFVAPRNPVEKQIAEIWSELIGIDKVGIYDNFFELGGHSLLATQMNSRIRKSFNIEFPLLAVFESTTLEELALQVEKTSGDAYAQLAPSIEPVDREKVVDLPLSFAQQRLWFLDKLEPGNTFYNIPTAIRLKGKLDVDALEKSMMEILKRHDSLRTNFYERDGIPYQKIEQDIQFELERIDLIGKPHAERETEVLKLAGEDARKPFDLSRGPLFRASLIILDENDHVILFTMHHIISDGWSVNIMIQEIATIYDSLANQKQIALPVLPVQYADFAHWQRNWLQGEVLGRQLQYWVEKLSDAPSLIELPTDRPRPSVKTFNGALQSFDIQPELTGALRKLTETSGATLFMSLLAAFQTLIHRYSGQDIIPVGSPIANRNQMETEGVIGFFANTLVFSTDFSGDPSFNDLLKRVRKTALGAYEHQDIPFEKLVEVLQPERDMSYTPLFQVMFVMQNKREHSYYTSDLEIAPIIAESGTTQYDLTLSIEEGAEEISGVLEYNTDLFNKETITQIIGNFQTLLQTAVENPDLPISRLALLKEAEEQGMLYDWNSTASQYVEDRCVHQLFEEQVVATPEKIAVVFEDEQLTYKELNERANQLANHLRKLGVGTEILVGLCVERSLDMIVGLLGILKAGGAYLPIDPTYPVDRIDYMIADAQVGIVLTQQQLVNHISTNDGTQTICLDSDWEHISHQSTENHDAHIQIDNLAYVIYTSGSTGRPKGVMLRHRGINNLTKSQIADFAVDETSRILQFASFSFDASISEIFTALLSGATLYLAQKDTLLSASGLVSFFKNNEITIVTLPPSLLNILEPEDLAGLKTIVSAGEACTKAIANKWHQAVRFVNAYGPTEATVGVTSYIIDHIPAEGSTIPIGKPVSNTKLYILDEFMNPVPRGVAGELFIGSVGLARGYINRPDLTAEKFVPNPFSDESGARLYRTGDLVRFFADGNIEFLGRLDHQVKIRGYRIEIGEIESALNQHEDIQQAVVTAKKMPYSDNDHQLVAYMVLTQDREFTVNQARDFLKERLPEYMIPTYFITLSKLPMLPNGKINRKALPDPEVSDVASSGHEYVAPRTPTEELLAVLWGEILGVEKVGMFDNFFELGGHSLLATQLVSRVKNAFQVELPIRDFFETPFIFQLAQIINKLKLEQDSIEVPNIERVDRDRQLMLSFAQQRLWFLDHLEADTASYNLPSAIRVTGDLNVKALNYSLNEVIRRHEILRTRFTAIEGKPIQVIVPELTMEIPIVDLQHLPEEERENHALELAVEEAQKPFDLKKCPLIRVKLVQLKDNEYVLLFTMHHIISDGWSMGILIQEVGALYDAYLNKKPTPMPDLAIQYVDFAQWQRTWLQGKTLDMQIDYWKNQLAGSTPLLALPTDRPRPPIQTYQGRTKTFEIPKELSTAISRISRQEGATLFMTLMAAFQTLLYRYSGQEDINVGTPIANRNKSETESLIGFFVNTLVIRTDFTGEDTFQDIIRKVRETSLGAYAYQDLPFETLVDIIQPKRNTSHTPLFQVMFVLQNLPMGAQELTDLVLEPIEPETGIAKFDLTLTMVESPDGFNGSFEFNTDLFDPETIDKMILHFRNLLEAIAEAPAAPISKLQFIAEDERNQMLTEWNDTTFEYANDSCIHELVEQWAEKTPDEIAAVFEDQTLTYAELNKKANQLAHYLQKSGVGPETLVGMYMERSMDVVISILAIIKAGGAYVPMDPVYPQDRIAFMLEDTATPILLTQTQMLDRLPEVNTRMICLDEEWETIAKENSDNIKTEIDPENIAYVIYTSGSTGKPKGCMINHNHVIRLFKATDDWFHFDSNDVWTFFHSYAFDFSVWEIWGALLYGGKLVVVPYMISRSPEGFYELLAKERVTVLNQTPSAFRQLIRAEEVVGMAPDLALRLIIFGGEALELNSLKPWYDRHGDKKPQLVNMYGITETTVHVTYRPLQEIDLTTAPGSVIGNQIPDLHLYVLDEHLMPVPVGVPGELFVGGAGVARGYLNRPELSAQRFIPHPFSEKEGDRLYKTGDLARYLRDGDVEYLGRIDHQVKIRGFRIELGEIESVLVQHSMVQEAFALVREDEAGSKRLVAYLVATAETAPNISELRSFMQNKVPDYMVPSAFVFMEKLPLTPNGKIDRKSLPVPDHIRPELESVYVAPRTEEEKKLAEIWAKLLNLEQVGIKDNFFELGGDSILTIQVIARAKSAGLYITPLQMFQYPTIEELAAVVETNGKIHAEQGVVTGTVPLTPIQRWFFEHHPYDEHHFNTSLFFELGQKLDIEILQETLKRMLMQHDALRLRFFKIEGTWVSENADIDEQLPFYYIDLTKKRGRNQKNAYESAKMDLQTTFDLANGPLIKVAYFDFGSNRGDKLLVVFHHLVIDGVSLRFFMEDFMTIYMQLNMKKDVVMPQKTTSYQYWAMKLSEYAQSEEARSEIEYWQQLNDFKNASVPVDFQNGENTYGISEDITFSLSEKETRFLLQTVPAVYHVQMNDILLTALVKTFRKWTGNSNLLVEMEGHGREGLFRDVDLSRTIGWFTSIFPAMLDLEKAEGIEQELEKIKNQLNEIPNRGIGYNILKYLAEDDEVKKLFEKFPHPEINFNYLGQFDQLPDIENNGNGDVKDGNGSAEFAHDVIPMRMAMESPGPEQSRDVERSAVLYFVCVINGGQLHIRCLYSKGLHRSSTIKNLVKNYISELRKIITSCQKKDKEQILIEEKQLL